MDLFTYLMAKKGHNTHRDLFSYLLGKGAGGSGTYVNFTGTSLNISNTLRARIKNITLKGATSQDGTPTPETPIPIKVVTGEQNVKISSPNLFDYKNQNYSSTRATYLLENNGLKITSSGTYAMITSDFDVEIGKTYTMSFNTVNNDNVGAGIQIRSSSALLITGGGPTGYTSLTFTATENKVYFRFYSNTSGTPRTNIVEYQNIQIEEGDVATPYVPYSNSKDYPLSLGSWNLLNYDLEAESYYYDSSGNKTYDNIFKYINQRIEVGLGSSITCTAESMTSNALMRICEFSSNDLFLKRSLVNTTERTITLNNNTSYIIVSIDKSNDRYFLKPQITKGTDIKPYCPYGEHYNENPLELAEITETYQDYIYGSPNNWYKYGAITKIKLSDLTWSLQSYGFQAIINLSNIVKPSNTNTMAILLCNVYRACTPNDAYGLTGSLEHGISLYNNMILVRETIIRDLNDFNTMISSAYAYLVNIEPTSEPITDTTLIEQLNNLYNATSQDGTTIITCSSASDSNEIIVFSGDIKVTSVGNSLNTSLLSSNLQEETNIDDIQEEPTLDDVNETEDIEQNEEPIEEKVS